MASSFGGFSAEALKFFRQLEKNNDRQWFTPRKAQFEELVRQPMLQLTALVADDLRTFAVDNVKEPEKALFRIYRDTRFSKDKTPYKTHIAATFPRRGLPKMAGAGFYFSVSHTGIEVAGGMYMPGPAELAAVRAAVAADEKNFRQLISAKPLQKKLGELQGDRLARVPKGYPADHPAADLLRLKQFYFFTMLPAELALKPTLRREVIDRFKVMAGFVEFLNDAALRQTLDPDMTEEPKPKRPEPMF